jgi:murein DD-endopeptidase MepM/ murein hydrolase activator NlpD
MVLSLALLLAPLPGVGASAASHQPRAVSWRDGPTVALPVSPLVVAKGFDPPAKRWAAGHRGVDLRAGFGQPVYAAAPGLVIYAGQLVDRPVISIRHGFVRTTYEPVSPVVTKGQQVSAGQLIGHLTLKHASCDDYCLHFGAIAGDQYLDPLRMLGLLGPPILRPLW